MILTQELKDKIGQAWSYQAVTSCSWAMNELDRFALNALHKGRVEVEGYDGTIQDLKDFFIWKNQDAEMSQIPVLRSIAGGPLTDILNRLIKDLSIDRLSWKEVDLNNHYFGLEFSSQTGGFKLAIGQLENGKNFKKSIAHVADLKLIFLAEKKYKLTYKVHTYKFLNFISGWKENTFKFTRLEVF